MNKVTHMNDEDLKTFMPNTNFLQKMRDVSNPFLDSNDDLTDENVIIALIDLRRLHKHHYDFFILIFENIHYDFKDILSSKNIDVLQEALTLLKEMFNYQTKLSPFISDWARKYIPILLDLYLDNSEIRSYTYQVLYNISRHIICNEVIETYSEEIYSSKDSKLTDLAFKFLKLCLDSCNNYDIDNYIPWVKFIEILYDLYTSEGEKAEFPPILINSIKRKIKKSELDLIIEKHKISSMENKYYSFFKEMIEMEDDDNKNNNHLYK